MTTSTIPTAFALTLGALGLFSISCTAILAPRDDVQRCGTADDCDLIGDNRYTPVCKFDDGNLDLDSSQVDKICVADFEPRVNCDPAAYPDPNHVYAAAFAELGGSERYLACTEEQRGSQGCAPNGTVCNEGLSVNEASGLCDDGNDDTPVALDGSGLSQELVGQDVRDQFCRSFFCDDRFVCDGRTSFCVLCDPDRDFGDGGCGEVFIGGARSCAYNSDTSQCANEDASPDNTFFGTCS